MYMLSKAINLATDAHNGQFDKAGEPYILHPLRVMLQMTDEESRIVAVLHDTVEDTWLTLNTLQHEGFNQDILDAIDYITKRQNEGYFEYIRRCKSNELARRVKLVDLWDNMNLDRIKNPTEKDIERNKKYSKAAVILSEIE